MIGVVNYVDETESINLAVKVLIEILLNDFTYLEKIWISLDLWILLLSSL